MAHLLFELILWILVLDFVFERWLDRLNLKHLSPELPAALSGIYNAEKYAASQQYLKANSRLSMVQSAFVFLLVLAMLLFHGFAFLDEVVRKLTPNPYGQTLLFFGILGFSLDVLTLPFQWYGTFVIEEKFGFNKTTVPVFVTDKLKMWLVSGVVGGGLLLFIQWAYTAGGAVFWLIAFAGVSLFMIFMAMFYTSLIVPLFNKLRPLEEGELKTAIEKLAAQTGFPLTGIYIMDGSKRSTKANAYFSGLGPKKKIILYDTLLEELSTEEIVAVLAHEIGHYRKKHIYKGLVVSLAEMLVLFFLLGKALSMPEFSQAIGVQNASFYAGLLAFSLLYAPVSFILGIVENVLSRRHEYQADAFAVSAGLGKSLVNALIRLSVSSLSNLQPHPLYVFFHYSHPTLLQRKSAIEKQIEKLNTTPS
ncbi:M48 family metallopeptidase [Candidatus Sulfidibacterium hydrothermale]|uniref:M48 family metallopeptidase n=1 Tax=Candidatus Sulfidibacterium hydrothermale TaxID=2875962 RepID=UPI001F0B5B01|nr:M48 family metallopeptidase [Candidatus Sulfidibacterium hydrothermale]UBM62886.1 M48 family metallopeptidase [Candidatus Sulfidibacterium hydrothermale]